MTNFTPELLEQAKTAKSAEELLALAKENKIAMTEDEAKACFEQLGSKACELADESLDSVAGGAESLTSIDPDTGDDRRTPPKMPLADKLDQ